MTMSTIKYIKYGLLWLVSVGCGRPCYEEEKKEFTIDAVLTETDLNQIYTLWDEEGVPPIECNDACFFAYNREEQVSIETIEPEACNLTIYCDDEPIQDTATRGCEDTSEETMATIECAGIATRESYCDY